MFVFDHIETLPYSLRGEVLQLLESVEDEFIPPLSSRGSTHDEILDGSSFEGLDKYLERVASQCCIIAQSGGVLAGLLSYVHKVGTTAGSEETMPGVYVSTLCVSSEFRRLGLADALYSELESNIEVGSLVTVRTWSSNESHLALLNKRGYSLSREILKDRPNDLATVYYGKMISG